jgi:mono/diheme cytochrome c family protein
MTGLIISLVVLLALTIVFIWLAGKAWKSPHGWVKWLGGILTTLLAVVFGLVTVLAGYGTFKLYQHTTVTEPQVIVAGTPEQVARGEKVALMLCAGCHSETSDLPLSGGSNLSVDAGMPLGDIYAPNLTPAGEIANWTDADLFRVIRTGVDNEGRVTSMVNFPGVQALSDEDVLSVIAYLRQAEPMARETPPFRPSLLLALLAAGGFVGGDVPAEITPIVAPPVGVTAEYGKYVKDYMECVSCHGEALDGVVPPPFPPGPDIRPSIQALSAEQFISLVEAKAAAATPADLMIWQTLNRLDSTEKKALWLYLKEFVAQ